MLFFESDIPGTEAFERKQAELNAEKQRAEKEARRSLTYEEYQRISRSGSNKHYSLLQVDLSTVPDELRGLVEMLQKDLTRKNSF